MLVPVPFARLGFDRSKGNRAGLSSAASRNGFGGMFGTSRRTLRELVDTSAVKPENFAW